MSTFPTLWTPAEDAILEALAADGAVVIATATAALINAGYQRTAGAVCQRAATIGLSTTGHGVIWTDAEITILRLTLRAEPAATRADLRAALAANGYRRTCTSIDALLQRTKLRAELTTLSAAQVARERIARDAKLIASVIHRVCPLGPGAAA